ncbi:MAG: HPF/RaiA family ribosome-associated protein [Thiolinea sp.]
MNRLQIEWGNVGRSEAIEQYITQKSEKIFMLSPEATKLVVYCRVINPIHSAGQPRQKISMELRLPQHQDLRAENEGKDLYKCIRDSKQALLAQIKSRKQISHDRAVDLLVA